MFGSAPHAEEAVVVLEVALALLQARRAAAEGKVLSVAGGDVPGQPGPKQVAPVGDAPAVVAFDDPVGAPWCAVPVVDDAAALRVPDDGPDQRAALDGDGTDAPRRGKVAGNQARDGHGEHARFDR